jgi:hypothetical protein
VKNPVDQPDQATATFENRQDRRQFLGAAAMGIVAASAASLLPLHPVSAANDDEIRPFHVDFPEQELVELRRRVAATRWPAPATSRIAQATSKSARP